MPYTRGVGVYRQICDDVMAKDYEGFNTAGRERSQVSNSDCEVTPFHLCHGDAGPANVVMHDGRIVLMDWATCQLAPIGSDLAKLFGHASAAVRDQPSVVRECLDAYAEAMSATLGAPPRRSQIKLGYRYQLIAHSFRKVLARLPAPLTPGPVRDPCHNERESDGHGQRPQRSSVGTAPGASPMTTS